MSSLRLFPVLAFLVLASVATLAHARVSEVVYMADLSADQVAVPLELPAKGSGMALCRFERESRKSFEVTCEVQHSIPTGAGSIAEITKIGIYRGAPGQQGSPVLSFTIFQASRVVETFVLNPAQEERMLSDFLEGLWFIQIHTIDNPNGEIRGQLLHNKRLYAQMDGSKVVPATRSGAGGLLSGIFTFREPNDILDVRVFHTVVAPTAFTLNEGEINENGEEIISVPVNDSPFTESIKYAQYERPLLLDDLNYATIDSVSRPAGEIRGQLISIDYLEKVDYTSRLGGSGNATGCGLVSFDCESMFVEFIVHHNLPGNTTTFLVSRDGNRIVASFSFLSSPSYGRVRLTENDAASMDRDEFVLVVRSIQTEEQIQGPVNTDFPYWTHISGTNVFPPVTTAASGCATMRLVQNDRQSLIDYEIVHSVPEIVLEKATLNVGPEGFNSNQLFEIFPSAQSPMRAREDQAILLEGNNLNQFEDGEMYIMVHSLSYPLGQIRGQIHLIEPCLRPVDTQSSTQVARTSGFPSSYRFDYSGTLTTPPNPLSSSTSFLGPNLMLALLAFALLLF